MYLNSYKLSREFSSSNPRAELLREKKYQINELYHLAVDREDGVFLNGKSFIKSPRIFDHKFIDTFHHKITVETIVNDDWIECGDYLEFDNMTWLCLNSYSFHKLYCRATFMSCDWKIYWINEKGELKSQYVIDQNSTQYNSGEINSQTMILGSAQHMLRMQCNEDTILLDSPIRFAIDRNIKNPTCYKVTQNDNSAYNYGKGLCCVTVTEDRLNINNDRLIDLDNGTKVWICDYMHFAATTPSPDEPGDTIDLTAHITGNTNIKIGIPRLYTVNFTDNKGTDLNWSDVGFTWNIVSDFDIQITQNDNWIKLITNDDSLIGESFLLQILVGNNVIKEIEISIVDVI